MTVAHPTGCFPSLFFSNRTSTLFKNLYVSIYPGEGGIGPQALAIRKLRSFQLISLSVSTELGSGPWELWARVSSLGRSCPPWAAFHPSYRPQVSTSGHRKDGEWQRQREPVPMDGMVEPSFLGVSCYVEVGSGFSLPFRWRRLADSSSFRSQLASVWPLMTPWNLSQTCHIMWWIPCLLVPHLTASSVRVGTFSCSQRCP